MNIPFGELEIGDGFIAYLKGVGAIAFVKTSARKAKCFINGKFKEYFFKSADIVYVRNPQ
jgi:hypothetical protein